MDVVQEELKSKLLALRVKLPGYDFRVRKFRQNRCFQPNQKEILSLNGRYRNEKTVSQMEKKISFFRDGIWDGTDNNNKDTTWLQELENSVRQQGNIEISGRR